jgi:hypothetical protein
MAVLLLEHYMNCDKKPSAGKNNLKAKAAARQPAVGAFQA